MSDALFAYGSLMFPSVFQAVTGCERSTRPASLPGYRRRLLRAHDYPAIIQDPDESTEGFVFDSIDADAWERLDRFEGSFYERREVEVDCAGRRVNAWAYVLPTHRAEMLADESWDAAAFEREHLEGWLIRLRR